MPTWGASLRRQRPRAPARFGVATLGVRRRNGGKMSDVYADRVPGAAGQEEMLSRWQSVLVEASAGSVVFFGRERDQVGRVLKEPFNLKLMHIADLALTVSVMRRSIQSGDLPAFQAARTQAWAQFSQNFDGTFKAIVRTRVSWPETSLDPTHVDHQALLSK